MYRTKMSPQTHSSIGAKCEGVTREIIVCLNFGMVHNKVTIFNRE